MLKAIQRTQMFAISIFRKNQRASEGYCFICFQPKDLTLFLSRYFSDKFSVETFNVKREIYILDFFHLQEQPQPNNHLAFKI